MQFMNATNFTYTLYPSFIPTTYPSYDNHTIIVCGDCTSHPNYIVAIVVVIMTLLFLLLGGGSIWYYCKRKRTMQTAYSISQQDISDSFDVEINDLPNENTDNEGQIISKLHQ